MVRLTEVISMPYTVRQLAELAGISPRTLRYYDEIGLLPVAKNDSGYRLYGQEEVDRLQQILFYRELGLSLPDIREILAGPSFDALAALKGHREKLLAQRERLDALIANLEKTIAMKEGKLDMTDNEKFEGFKQRLIEENEEQYGKEVREKYGEDRVARANQRIKNMTQKEYAQAEKLSAAVNDAIKAAMQEGDPASPLARKACEMHRQWLLQYWGEEAYSPEAHMALAQMYVDDPRFTAYYDAIAPGAAVFLRDAMRVYTGVGKE